MTVNRLLLSAALLVTLGMVPTLRAQPTAITNADVIRFVAMGLPDQAVSNLINEAVAARAARFDVSPLAVAALASHGVSPTVIAAMGQLSAPTPQAVVIDTARQPSTQGSSGGIQPLTPETLAAAKVDHGPVLNSPFEIRSAALMAVNRFGGRAPVYAYAFPEDGRYMARAYSPFSFHIETPYMVVSDYASEAARKFSDPRFPSLDVLNAGLVRVVVGPGQSVTIADTIENVMIKRGGQMIKPLRATVTPTVIETLLGVKRASAIGVFTFDYATFAPTTAITIVMVGKTGNLEWTMPPEELRRLK